MKQGAERDRPTVRVYATPAGTVTATDVDTVGSLQNWQITKIGRASCRERV